MISPRIQSLRFDRCERPLCATIRTCHGTVRVEWRDVAGDWCWFTAGTGEAKRAAALALLRIEAMLKSLR